MKETSSSSTPPLSLQDMVSLFLWSFSSIFLAHVAIVERAGDNKGQQKCSGATCIFALANAFCASAHRCLQLKDRRWCHYCQRECCASPILARIPTDGILYLWSNSSRRCLVPVLLSLFNLRDVHLNLHWHGASATVRFDKFVLVPHRIPSSCCYLAPHR